MERSFEWFEGAVDPGSLLHFLFLVAIVVARMKKRGTAREEGQSESESGQRCDRKQISPLLLIHDSDQVGGN